MKGDFSKWRFDAADNHAGVLHQQGKVLLDSDWNSATRIQGHWNASLGRDAMGAFTAAFPAGEADAFKVAEAAADGARTTVKLLPGRLWADGILVQKTAGPDLVAEQLGLPFQTPPAASSAGAGVRDAVILEVWEEALSGFQDPVHLLEPALGGPDTTERIQVAMGLKLLRLEAGEDCESIGARIQDDLGSRGRLTVTPKPEIVLGSDCPVQTGGGYTGFEHRLYRIEVAEPADGKARIKWSQFNGGLVGRGRFDSVAARVRVTANDQMINHAGLTSFYLEALRFEPERGHWRVHFSADATLAADGELSLANPQGAWPAAGTTAFFRLWNGIALVEAFPKGAANPAELKDGIRLELDAAAADLSNYVPGNYWTFPARAVGVPFDPSLWPANEPPQGAVHRVPLAVIAWPAAAPVTAAAGPGSVHDCRKPIHPLTGRCGCCYRVGDGRTSFGDFDSVEEALAHLPMKGGKLCVLPGIHRVSALIRDRRDIFIEGCERQALLIPRPGLEDLPIFRIADSRGIFLEKLDMLALADDAVLAKGGAPGRLKDIVITRNRIVACRHAVAIAEGEDIRIDHNLIRMLDKDTGREAILCQADGGLIERNDIGTVPAGTRPPPGGGDDGEEPDPTDPCAEPPRIYKLLPYLPVLVAHYWALHPLLLLPSNPYRTLGGIRVAGGSERVRVLENRIAGGAGNGITLGGAVPRTRDPEQLQPQPDSPRVLIRNRRNSVFGRVLRDGLGAPGVVVTLQDAQGGPLLSGVADASGEFEIKAPPGEYVADVATPGLRLRDAKSVETPAGGAEHELTVEAFAAGGGAQDGTDPLELAFLRDIEVTSNEIGEMGLSGIGVPYLAPRPTGVAGSANTTAAATLSSALLFQAFGQMGGFAIGLSIHRNRIRRCLRNVFTDDLLARARTAGLGGISLGLCERLTVNENVIEDNGRGHVNPVCGIYVAYANRADIVENRIADNGALDPDATGQPREGQRGGIVVRLAAALSLEETLAQAPPASPAAGLAHFAAAARQTLPKGQYALRVLDNSVQQPLNRSLQALALGPVMVCGNFFHTDAAFAGVDQVMMAGTLYLLNLGRPGATQGRAVLPGGQTLVNDNQIQLGFAVNCNSSQAILTQDDLGMDGNQGEVDRETALVTHAAVLAGTVRASGNRYQEPKREGSFKISLYTIGAMLNNTAHNQGDHCTVALCMNAARPAVDVGNQVTGTAVDPCRTLNLILGQALSRI